MPVTTNIKKLLLAAVIFLIAFFVRFYSLSTEGVNPDEPVWQHRIENFTSAISKQEWHYTQQSLHPAVSLSWLAATGRALAGYSQTRFVYPFVDPSIFWEVHFAEIIMIILVTAISCSGIFWLLSKLVPAPAAFLSSLLIALDPFYIANSRILHMDALLASFMILGFLSLLVHLRTEQRPYLFLAGGLSGLAILTKINGVVILAIGAAILFLYRKTSKDSWWKAVVVLMAVAGATFFLLYPAMWTQPLLTVKNLIYGVIGRGLVEGGESMGDVFFLGKVLTDPGPLFYPLVTLFRTTPLVLLGAVAALIVALKTKRNFQFVINNLLFIGLILLEMTIVAKKSERYILPMFLGLDVIAGIGLYEVWKRFSRYLILVLIVGFQFLVLAIPLSFHYGAYYNPLLGGAQAAAKAITVGFGEGHTEVAAFINDFQDKTTTFLWVSAFYGDSLRPLVKIGDIWYPSQWNRGDRDAHLVVFYINQLQRQKDYSLWQEYQNQTPLKTVKINGVDYALIFKGPAFAKIK